jgi:diaminopimelate decarboxylase
MGFFLQDNYLYCEGRSVKQIQKEIPHSPFYLYSSQQLKENYLAYADAIEGVPGIISYAVKANGNLALLHILRKLGSWVTLVSGNELRLALAAGFDPSRAILNGNGKTLAELELAIAKGVMVNIDSEFDLEHIRQVSQSLNKKVDVLLRFNPDIDPAVHPYISTGLRNSKFGIHPERIAWFLKQLQGARSLNLLGVHCHLGSTIDKIQVFHQVMERMVEIFKTIQSQGFPVKYLNIGGGLGIDYYRKGEVFPGPVDLLAAVQDLLPAGAQLVLEPGRSIVGNAGIFVCRVIGVKSSGSKRFIVIDGSMAELIRPSLYQAYHEIGFIEPVDGERQVFDVVGPVCESADFLGQNRPLATPKEGVGVVIYDTGAYGYVMSSNYNARMRPPEYLIDGDLLIQIRQAEDYEDYLKKFEIT